MCSMPDPRLIVIGTAIDELAEDAAGEGLDTLHRRLAELWAMVAAMDPELAQRLPGYQDQARPG
jgi:hypothetical protein